jgi:hypothetical protein
MIYLLILLQFINTILSIKFTISNLCTKSINIYSHEDFNFENKCKLDKNQYCILNYNKIESGLIKTALEENATLFEFTINNKGIWYDISVIPPGSGSNCFSYEECYAVSKKESFNIPLQVSVNNNCKNLACLTNKCADAYLFPSDDLKTHYCNLTNTEFNLVYCPNNNLIVPNITALNKTMTLKTNSTKKPKLKNSTYYKMKKTLENSTMSNSILYKMMLSSMPTMSPNMSSDSSSSTWNDSSSSTWNDSSSSTWNDSSSSTWNDSSSSTWNDSSSSMWNDSSSSMWNDSSSSTWNDSSSSMWNDSSSIKWNDSSSSMWNDSSSIKWNDSSSSMLNDSSSSMWNDSSITIDSAINMPNMPVLNMTQNPTVLIPNINRSSNNNLGNLNGFSLSEALNQIINILMNILKNK